MTEKRFVYEEEHYNFPIKKRIRDAQNNETHDLKECCDIMNEQQITIEELQQKYDKLCIEIANIYSKYIFMKEFSEDTNPNEAVKYVLRELMQKTKEVR